MRKIHWIEWDCEVCGKHVKKMRKEVGMLHKRRFCGHVCADSKLKGNGNPAWAGGYKPNNHYEWRKNKKLALERDGDKCTRCGKTSVELSKHPDVHHKEKRNTFASDSEYHALSNLLSLCHDCHMILEWHTNKKSN